jgi:rhodanese-related sulfurtransferase
VVPEIDLTAFAAAHACGALVIDVREPAEYMNGHVPGAHLVPLSAVHSRAGELPKDQPVYVICASGNRSYTAAGWLRGAGVAAVSVAPGTGGWRRGGYPLVYGAAAGETAASAAEGGGT